MLKTKNRERPKRLRQVYQLACQNQPHFSLIKLELGHKDDASDIINFIQHEEQK